MPETAATPPTPQPPKRALTEDELDKKSTAIIEEYLHINDMKVCERPDVCDTQTVCRQ